MTNMTSEEIKKYAEYRILTAKKRKIFEKAREIVDLLGRLRSRECGIKFFVFYESGLMIEKAEDIFGHIKITIQHVEIFFEATYSPFNEKVLIKSYIPSNSESTWFDWERELERIFKSLHKRNNGDEVDNHHIYLAAQKEKKQQLRKRFGL